jgi:FkbM family methyltransferase
MLRPVSDHLVYTVRSGVASGLKRHGGLGFLPRPVPIEENFVKSLDLTNKVVYEIGAFEGIYTIYLASRASSVIVFEPHPLSQQRIRRNLALNGLEGRVVLRPVALGLHEQQAILTYPVGEPARASVDVVISQEIEIEDRAFRKIPVQMTTLDREVAVHGLPPPDFIKIDAEGAEYDILQGASETIARYRPQLIIEIHRAEGDPQQNARRIASLLEELGYSITHVEDGTPVHSATAAANLGHIYATFGGASNVDARELPRMG